MKTSVDDSGNNTDDDMNMAHRLESGGSGGGIRGEVDKGMGYERPFILFYSSWQKNNNCIYGIHDGYEGISEADNTVQ